MKKLILLSLILCILLPSCAKEQKPQIPILAWFSIPDGEFATLERYQELQDAGFTITFTHSNSFENAVKALDLCAAVGIKSVFTCPELKSDPEETVRKVMNHPGLGYYFLRDEPLNEDFEELGKWAARIKAVDSTHPCYLNLFPLHGFLLGPGVYEEHLRLFNEIVDLPQISYDHYPVIESGDTVELKAPFYHNLELVRNEGIRVNKPFWAFSLATAHTLDIVDPATIYPMPEIGHLRLQMYADLCYGAQCLQYFTYWNPSPKHTFNFHQAPIQENGKRSPIYDMIRDFNKEIQNRAFVFAGCKVESVRHTGNNIPEGTTRLENLPDGLKCLDTFGAGGLISCISNADRNFVVFQNTSPISRIAVNMEFDENVNLIRRDGSSVKATNYGPRFAVEAGDIVVLEIVK